MPERITSLVAGMPVLYGGDQVTHVDEELAAAFSPGDHLVVVQRTGDLLHVPAEVHALATAAVDAAAGAFELLGTVTDEQITRFYGEFADRLADETTFAPIAVANAADIESARRRGRSTTRLVLSDTMRKDMIEGLHAWRDAPSGRDRVIATVPHEGWHLDLVRSGLGVVGFVFEGRPNVFADATGVLRSGNTVVFRIGSDALGTAAAIVAHALDPALDAAGLPPGAVSLVSSPARAAGHALFSDTRLSLAVARGSGAAVAQLGAVARQAGIPVSLHGTGGAWIIASPNAAADAFRSAVYHSLDRKVCNTLNTCCIVESRVADLIPVFLEAVDRAGERRGAASKLHVTQPHASLLPDEWFDEVAIVRAGGDVVEPRTSTIADDGLGVEWEWEDSPEVTLTVVPDVAAAVRAFNRQSPRFVASLISDDRDEQERFFSTIDAPFVGNGFTRWVDGQYALDKPELGLSNWQTGRLFGRGAILSGDAVYTVRSRVIQDDPDVGR